MKRCLLGQAKPPAAIAKARNCSPRSFARQVVDVYEPVEDGSRDKAYISKVWNHVVLNNVLIAM